MIEVMILILIVQNRACGVGRCIVDRDCLGARCNHLLLHHIWLVATCLLTFIALHFFEHIEVMIELFAQSVLLMKLPQKA